MSLRLYLLVVVGLFPLDFLLGETGLSVALITKLFELSFELTEVLVDVAWLG